MAGQTNAFSEKTIIQISAGMLGTIGAGFISVVVWLATLSFQTNANTKDIEAVKADQKTYVDNLNEIKLQLAVIQGGLGIKYQSKQGK